MRELNQEDKNPNNIRGQQPNLIVPLVKLSPNCLRRQFNILRMNFNVSGRNIFGKKKIS